MAFLKRSVDAVNKQIQFEIAENANSVNIKFNPEFNAGIAKTLVRVEKITKNATDRVLYSGRFEELEDILKFAFGKLGTVLPFVVGDKALILSDDDKIVVTFTFTEELIPTSFEYEINKLAQTTTNPLVIKKLEVDEELTFSTEFYPLLLLPKATQSYETVVLKDESKAGSLQKVLTPTKIYLGNGYINACMENDHNFLPMVTSPDQKVTLKGVLTAYLILIS